MTITKREYNRIKGREWYQSHPDQARSNRRRSWQNCKGRVITEKRQMIHSAKAKPCMDCGIQYPYYVMEFDHLKDKVQCVSMMLRTSSLERIRKEIAKCEVVCANCHRERTHTREVA